MYVPSIDRPSFVACVHKATSCAHIGIDRVQLSLLAVLVMITNISKKNAMLPKLIRCTNFVMVLIIYLVVDSATLRNFVRS